MNFVEPRAGAESYTCPHCNTLSQQKWWNSNKIDIIGTVGLMIDENLVRIGTCIMCKRYSIWLGDKMLYPCNGDAPSPEVEMPEEVKKLYLEAASIKSKSPRGAAALLRLAVQHLCKELGGTGTNINADIKLLVENGLPIMVQQSLDTLRVIGNNAVHPGQIDTDDKEIVNNLFKLINVIVKYMISLPNEVQSTYNELPQNSLEAIKKRDKK